MRDDGLWRRRAQPYNVDDVISISISRAYTAITIPYPILEALKFKMAEMELESIEEPYSLRRLEHRLLRRSDNMHCPGGEGSHTKNGEITPSKSKLNFILAASL